MCGLTGRVSPHCGSADVGWAGNGCKSSSHSLHKQRASDNGLRKREPPSTTVKNTWVSKPQKRLSYWYVTHQSRVSTVMRFQLPQLRKRRFTVSERTNEMFIQVLNSFTHSSRFLTATVWRWQVCNRPTMAEVRWASFYCEWNIPTEYNGDDVFPLLATKTKTWNYHVSY